MSECDRKNKIDAPVQQFTLSAKSVRKMTREDFGYELSSNAFDLLNQKAKEKLVKGCRVGDVNDWVMRVLEGFEGKRMVKRSDMEPVMEKVDGEIELVRSEESEDKITTINQYSDNTADIDEIAQKSDTYDIQIDKKSDSSEIQIDQKSNTTEIQIDQNSTEKTEKLETIVGIVQLHSLGEVDIIKDLEDEIERLKRIIQIILNKQAELV